MGSSWVYSITAWDVQAQGSNYAALMKEPDGERGASVKSPEWVCVDVGTRGTIGTQGGNLFLFSDLASKSLMRSCYIKRTNAFTKHLLLADVAINA